MAEEHDAYSKAGGSDSTEMLFLKLITGLTKYINAAKGKTGINAWFSLITKAELRFSNVSANSAVTMFRVKVF